MKKILFLLTALIIGGVSAWANYKVSETPISTAEQLVDGVYALSVRSNSYSGYLYYTEDSQPFRFNNGQGISTFSASNVVTNEAYLWRIKKEESGFSIQSVSSNEFISNRGASNDNNFSFHGNIYKVGQTAGSETAAKCTTFTLSAPAADGNISRFNVWKTEDGQLNNAYAYFHTNGGGNQTLSYWNGGNMDNMNSGSACKIAFYPVEEGNFEAPDNPYFTLGKVYRMQLRQGADPTNYPFFYNATSGRVETRNANNPNAFVENRLFYFKKNSNGYTLHCIGAGDDKGFEVAAVSSNDATGSMTTTPSNFVIQTNSNGGFSLKHTGATCHINDVSGNVGVWANGTSSQNDRGSMFTLTEITENDINSTSASTEIKAAAIANPNYTNVAALFRVINSYTVHITGAGENSVVVRYGESTYGDTQTFQHEGTLTSENVTIEGVPAHRGYTLVINNLDVNVIVYPFYHSLNKVATLESGHKYMIYNATDDNGTDRTGFVYGGINKVTHCGSHPSPLTFKGAPEYLWTITEAEEGGYTIYNEATGKYYNGSGNAQNDAVTVYIQPWMTAEITKPDGQCNVKETFGNIVLKANITEEQKVFAISGSASGHNGSNCWNGNPETFANWSNSHPWAFYEVCEVEATINDNMITIAGDYANYKVSQNAEHPRKYGTFNEANKESVNALTSSNTFEEYVTAIGNVVSTHVVAPAKGSFIRVQGATSNNFIAGDGSKANNRAALVADADQNKAETIIYYTSAGELIGYKSGLGFIDTHNIANVNQTFEKHEFLATNYGPNALEIRSDYTGSKLLYDGTTDINRNSSADSHCAWYVYDVTSLPVLFKAAGLGYATLYSPVALEIPEDEGVTVYTVGNEENEGFLKVTAMEGGVIPANTGVVLYKEGVSENTTVQFPIATVEPEAVNSTLTGTVAAKAYETGSYVFSIVSENPGFYKLAETANLAGFKAYYVPTTPSEVQGFVLNFGGEGTTGIQSLIESAKTNGISFDLAGRRVNADVKGISIQNNKKVIR